MTPSFRSSARLQRLLIAASLFVPMLLFAGAAWKSRMDALHEGEATVLNAVEVVSDSLRSRLRTEDLALLDIMDHLQGLDWSEIASPETSTFLVEVENAFNDLLSAIWIADRDGIIRAASWG
jgi:hypothetical protein